jgi:hypothetical protein
VRFRFDVSNLDFMREILILLWRITIQRKCFGNINIDFNSVFDLLFMFHLWATIQACKKGAKLGGPKKTFYRFLPVDAVFSMIV